MIDLHLHFDGSLLPRTVLAVSYTHLLSSKETGRIGGLMTKKKKELNKSR